MSVFKISKAVPVPSDLTLNRKFYPWTELNAGESFFVRGAKVTSMSAKAAWAGRQYHKQFICRSVRGGVRVWCLGERDPAAPRKRNSWNQLQAGEHEITIRFDPAASTWVATSATIEGLVTSGVTLEEVGRKCDLVIPELLKPLSERTGSAAAVLVTTAPETP